MLLGMMLFFDFQSNSIYHQSEVIPVYALEGEDHTTSKSLIVVVFVDAYLLSDPRLLFVLDPISVVEPATIA